MNDIMNDKKGQNTMNVSFALKPNDLLVDHLILFSKKY